MVGWTETKTVQFPINVILDSTCILLKKIYILTCNLEFSQNITTSYVCAMQRKVTLVLK